MSELVQFDLDPSIYNGAGNGLDAIYSDLEKAVRLDLRYHYSGPIGARHWLSLCNSRQYGHSTLATVIEAEIPNALGVLKTFLPARHIELVSFGVGDGDIDRRILRRLQEEFEGVSYVCIDISFELLRHATAHITAECFDKMKTPVRAIWGDFTKIQFRSKPCGDSARVFSLTGFTFGNHDESRLMETVDRSLSPGDFLFLDARLHQLGTINGNFTGTFFGR